MSGASSGSGRSAAMWPWLVAGAGLLSASVPTFIDLFRGVWASDEQGHGPIVLIVSLWLLYKKLPEALSIEGDAPNAILAWPLILTACLFYAIGRSQGILSFEVSSLIWMLIGLVTLLHGPKAVRVLWFGFFFMFFMVPLPGAIVDAVTQPMKTAVSYVAENLLFWAGYPVSRTGVILQIGQYQLLVADACAGLHTLLTLEAMGLLYLNLVKYASLLRNVFLALLIVPISFAANVIRVIVLTLITYHFGDEAGQGFLHGFAGMVLFLSALLLIMSIDSVLRSISRRRIQVRV